MTDNTNLWLLEDNVVKQLAQPGLNVDQGFALLFKAVSDAREGMRCVYSGNVLLRPTVASASKGASPTVRRSRRSKRPAP